MNIENVQLEPGSEIRFIECKFTVENKTGNGGDFERNTGGSMNDRRITFEGYVTSELYATLANSITKVLSNDE